MNLDKAIAKAQRIAKKTGDFQYVVLDDIEFGEYEVASEYDLETFYLACPVHATVAPDGSIE